MIIILNHQTILLQFLLLAITFNSRRTYQQSSVDCFVLLSSASLMPLNNAVV